MNAQKLPIMVLWALGIVAVVVLLALFGLFPGGREATPAAATVEFWGFEDDEQVWRDLITKFSEANPHITVNYTRFPAETYETNLVNRLAEGKGPDVFMLKNTWLAKHRDKIAPLPATVSNINASNFTQIFVDGAAAELIYSPPAGAQNTAPPAPQVLGLPIFYDTLALFYNKDIFNAVGIAEAPRTWEDVTRASQTITQKTRTGDITRSGLALGTYQNVEHAFEIISALIMQYGDPIIRSASSASPNRTETVLGREAEDALTLYASFADSSGARFSWTSREATSLDAFAEGKTAMAAGFAADLPRIGAKNPHLNFGILPFPQLAGAGRQVTFASHRFLTVSRLSRNQTAAWQFALYAATGPETANYLVKTGLPPARRDLVARGAPAPSPAAPTTGASDFGVFYRQSLIGRSWPVPDEAVTKRIFREMIESINARAASVNEALNRAKGQLGLLLPR